LTEKTPYELWKGKKPHVLYYHSFGIQGFILNTKESLGKFSFISNKEILYGY